jgi:TerC family integral membrane protein
VPVSLAETEETFGPSRHAVRRLIMISVVSPVVWAVTVAVLLGILILDLAVIGRRQRTVATKDAVRWVLVYVGLAVAFAAGLFVFAPGSSGQEFVAGYITEYSLSVDNLFVFMIIMARFAVPELAQDKVLYIGIVLSLVFRAAFIFAGAAAIAAWSWVFYILGGFLVYTAIQLALEDADDEPDFHKNPLLRFLRRILPLSEDYDGRRLVTRTASVGSDSGAKRRQFTPLVIVIAAIGIANVVFALDSIPAIFGLTNDAYIIFTANALALMGLRQLYFLIGGLLEKIVYLSKGLAVILGFIGVKLIIEALHHSHLDHVGNVQLPEIGIVTSLLFIVATLTITTVLSLMKTRRDLKRAAVAAD